VFPDGRFVRLSVPGEAAGDQPLSELRAVLNWIEELKRLVPSTP
jgi:hypothetical protein